jgi:site-specific recombinase XerD
MAPSNYATTVDDYLLDCRRRGLRPATIRYYGQVLERVGRACDLADPADLSLAKVRGFQDEPGRLSPRSVRGSLVALKTFSRWLADEDVLTADPLARLRLPRVDQGVVTAPTDRELLALLWAAGPLLRTVLALLLGTGVRISDLTDLAVDDLRPGELVVARTKNRAGRLVPLDPVLEALLARHVADRGSTGFDALFVTRTGRPLTPDATRQVLADARARARLDVRVTPHIVRHWHARDLAAHGTSERLLAATSR